MVHYITDTPPERGNYALPDGMCRLMRNGISWQLPSVERMLQEAG